MSRVARGDVRDPTLSESSPRSRSPIPSSAASSSSSHSRPSKFIIQSISIPLGVESDNVVYYTINVTTKDGDRWSSRKRFSAFERLHQVLMELFGHRGFPPGADLPSKKLKFFVSHVSEHFIEERRCLLESYLNKMSKVPEVVKSDVWLDFLGSDMEAKFYEPPAVETTADSHLDDAEITGVSLPQTRLMSDHVLYQVDVVNIKKRRTFSKWTVLKRFNQFLDLDAAIRTDFAQDEKTLAALPASPQRQSKLLYDHMCPHFIEHRRVLLENYVQKLLQIPVVARNPTFLAFCGVQV